MIKINKTAEPECLLKYRKKKDASYNGLNKDDKYTIVDFLLREQGYLCAYCMQRISHEKGATIEHIVPQSEDASKALDYKNMLAVCNGNQGKGKDGLICDKHRGNDKLTVNPLDEKTIEKIRYINKNGIIFSDDAEINEDLNKTLNLNCEKVNLPKNRKAAHDAFVSELRKIGKSGDIHMIIKKYIEKYSGFNKRGQKYEYCGIILDWLKKHDKE